VSGLSKRFEWVYRFLSSKKLTLVLFLVLGLFLIPRTFTEAKEISLGIPGSIIFGLMSLNLILCTVQRIRSLAKPVIVIHTGILVTFAGVVISTFGYIATINIYEDSSMDTVYRWDKEKDMPLGVDLKVKNIHLTYYPFPVKVGVLRGEEKVGLFELKTGASFPLENFEIKVESLDLPSKNLRVSVLNEGHSIGSAETDGTSDLPADFPYDFKLVAYQDSPLRRAWVDLEISKDEQILAKGTSEVNSPLTWGKINFHFTKLDYDPYGNPYAGIQITYDPGLPYVYAGFIFLGIGCLMYLRKRLYKKK
jgi:hypothetical protein